MWRQISPFMRQVVLTNKREIWHIDVINYMLVTVIFQDKIILLVGYGPRTYDFPIGNNLSYLLDQVGSMYLSGQLDMQLWLIISHTQYPRYGTKNLALQHLIDYRSCILQLNPTLLSQHTPIYPSIVLVAFSTTLNSSVLYHCPIFTSTSISPKILALARQIHICKYMHLGYSS